MLVRSRIKLKEFNEAMDEIERLQSAHGKQPRLKLLLAILHRSRGESQEALQLLLEYVEVSLGAFLLKCQLFSFVVTCFRFLSK